MRHLLLISVLLLGASWAVAQSDSTNAQSPAARPSTSGQNDAMPASSGGSTSVQGCLTSSNGKFTLTGDDGNTYQLSGDAATLSHHVGHEIKVTGSVSSETDAMQPQGGGSESGNMGTAKQKLEVTSVKHISKTCQNGGSMSH